MAAPTALPPRISTAPAAPAQTYYVDPSIGSDANTATQAKNPATPWATLNGALTNVPIPSTGANTPVMIYLRGTDGVTTRGFTITDAGPGSACPAAFQSSTPYPFPARIVFPPDSPLTISNYPGERVLFSIQLRLNYTAKYVRIAGTRVNGKKGIVIDTRFPNGNATLTGITMIGSQHCEFYGLEIRNNCWNGLGGGVGINAWSLSGVDSACIDPQVWNCYIHHNGGALQGGHGVYWGATTGTQLIGAIGGAFVNNRCDWNMDDNLDPHNCAQGTVFAHNEFLSWGGGWTGSGVSTTPLTATGGTRQFTDGITFFASNNSAQPQSKDCMVVNNILAYNFAYGLWQFDATTNGGNVEKNNLYFANGSGARRDASNTWQLLSTLINNDPLFLNWTPTDPTSNTRPHVSSPVGGAGDSRFTPTFDHDDNPRSQSDIGPYSISGSGSLPIIIGDQIQGPTNDAGFANARAAMQVTVPPGGMVVSEIRCWLQTYSGATTARVAIYADSAGAPGARIALSGDQALTLSAVQQAVFPISATLSEGVYWLAIGFDPTSPGVDLLVNAGSHVYSTASGALPDPFGAATVNSTFDMAISAHGTAYVLPPALSNARTLVGVGT